MYPYQTSWVISSTVGTFRPQHFKSVVRIETLFTIDEVSITTSPSSVAPRRSQVFPFLKRARMVESFSNSFAKRTVPSPLTAIAATNLSNLIPKSCNSTGLHDRKAWSKERIGIAEWFCLLVRMDWVVRRFFLYPDYNAWSKELYRKIIGPQQKQAMVQLGFLRKKQPKTIIQLLF